MTRYQSVALLRDLSVPGWPTRSSFATPDYQCSRDGDVVTVVHVATGTAVEVPWSGVWHAIPVPSVSTEDVQAAVTAKRGRK